MKKVLILTFLLLINLTGFSRQITEINQYDNNGLKVGYWGTPVEDGTWDEGRYIVIPLDKSVDYSKDWKAGDIYMHSNDHYFTLNYSGKTDELISVKEGEWITYIKDKGKGKKILTIEYYNKGYILKKKYITSLYPFKNYYPFKDYLEVFSMKDSIKREYTYYLINDKIVSDTIVYKSIIEGEKDKYYPYKNIEISDWNFGVNTLFSVPDTIYFRFKARKSVSIDSVTTPNPYVKFYHPIKKQDLNLKLSPNQADSIGIIFTPTTRDSRSDDTFFVLHGSDCNYKVFLYLNAWDINKKNIKSTDPIILNKNKDLKLYITNAKYMAMDYYLFDNEKYAKELNKEKAIKQGHANDMMSNYFLNLSDLNKGKYFLVIIWDAVPLKYREVIIL
jgi:hypothetical protein